MKNLKNMKHGKNRLFFLIILFNLLFNIAYAEDKIITSPLVNLDSLKPSYEEVEDDQDLDIQNNNSKLKKKIKNKNLSKKSKNIIINLKGLDKITAKTSDISIEIGKVKKFGLLEIKAIKCGQSNSKNETGEAAYIQVKDLSDNLNEKVFVFNGWTFSSSPSIKPIDHPVYDLWLVSCDNV